MYRYIACFIIEENNELVKKVQMITSEETNIIIGEIDVLKRISKDFNLPECYVDRDEDNPVKGVLYVRPKREYCPSDLCELDSERWEREEYNKIKIRYADNSSPLW